MIFFFFLFLFSLLQQLLLPLLGAAERAPRGRAVVARGMLDFFSVDVGFLGRAGGRDEERRRCSCFENKTLFQRS